MTRLPLKFYFAAVDYKRHGVGFTDPSEDLDRTLDLSVCDPDHGATARVFCVEMDPDTNAPESIRDITEDAIRDRNAWLRSQRREPITQDEHPLSDCAA